MFDILPLRAFNDNYIWLITDTEKRQAAAVESRAPQP